MKSFVHGLGLAGLGLITSLGPAQVQVESGAEPRAAGGRMHAGRTRGPLEVGRGRYVINRDRQMGGGGTGFMQCHQRDRQPRGSVQEV